MRIKGLDKNIEDFIYVLAGNSLNLFAGIFSGLLIPKFLDISQYGYYRIFTLYTLYLGVMHFGFNDGIYVRYGSFDYENLPKERFRAYSRFLFIFQIILSVIVALFCVGFVKDGVRLTIGMFISVNIIISNFIIFFSMISQITRRFNVYSFNTVVTKLAFIIFTVILLVMNSNNFMFYILSQTLVNAISMAIFMVHAKDLVFGKSERIIDNIKDILYNFKTGFLVMIGNLMGLLIINFGQFIAERFLNINDFALYAFSISLITIVINTLLNALSTVVFPFLSRNIGGDKKRLYERMETFVFIVLSASLAGYFVLKFIILSFLPAYAGSLDIGLIIFPVVLFYGLISIVASNFYKVLRMQMGYTINNVIAFVFVAVTTVVAYYLFRTTVAIAAAALISFYLWLLYSDCYFKLKLSAGFIKVHIAQIIVVGAFFLCGFMLNWYMGLILYIFMLAIILVAFYRKDLIQISREKLNYLKA